MPQKKQIFKTYTQGDYHYVFGEVYAPEIVDTDLESMKAVDIVNMAHDFIAKGYVKSLDTEHNHELCGAEVVESFIARKNDPDYTEGAWVLGVRMKDGPLWERIKSGELNSFSVDALVTRESSDRLTPFPLILYGNTLEQVDIEAMPAHVHEYYLEFDEFGNVAAGLTTETLGHTHKITGTVTTEKNYGHAHRFMVSI